MTDMLTNDTELEIDETEAIDEIEKVAEANDYVTVYGCAAVVNSWLETHKIVDETTETGFKQVPPQMFYNYTKKGYIEVTYVDAQPYVNVEDLKKWYVRYVTKVRSPKTKKSFAAPELPKV